jgi:ATP-dependent Clp protease adaptor protein ClpS
MTTTVPMPREETEEKTRTQPPYHVVLINDDDHTYEYVIVMLLELFGHPLEKGFQMAQEVDKSGRVIVDTTSMERAELKRDQIHAYGPDPRIARCAGSMSAEIEPAW